MLFLSDAFNKFKIRILHFDANLVVFQEYFIWALSVLLQTLELNSEALVQNVEKYFL